MRFRCVCKSWNALVSNPKFIKIHQKKSERNKNLVLIEKEYSSCMYKSLMVNYLPISRLVGYSLITLANDHILNEEEEDGFFIVGSCNGLVCLAGYSDLERWLYFYNPATRKLSKKLGTFTDTDKYRDMFGFGYDTSTDTHKVVNFSETSRDARIFSLGDNIWRSIPSIPDVRILYEYIGYACVYLSGTLNWLVLRKDITYDWRNLTVENFVIISLETETVTQLLPPRGSGEKLLVEPTICVFMDCLCTCYKGEQFVIWKMMKFGVEESWSQFLKISYQSLQRNCFNFSLLPLCLSESGDSLILGVPAT